MQKIVVTAAIQCGQVDSDEQAFVQAVRVGDPHHEMRLTNGRVQTSDLRLLPRCREHAQHGLGAPFDVPGVGQYVENDLIDEAVWNAVYCEAVQELKDAMDLAYLTGQRPADVLKIAATDLNNGFLLIGQGKTEKRLRIRLEEAGVQSVLGAFIDDLKERRAINGIKTSTLITSASGLRMSQQMLRNRWDDAREKAAIKAAADGDPALAGSIRQFQFKDIRPKAASEIELTHASRLLGHSSEEMTKKVYRRVGEIVNPTK